MSIPQSENQYQHHQHTPILKEKEKRDSFYDDFGCSDAEDFYRKREYVKRCKPLMYTKNCRNFNIYGSCRYGLGCHFHHEHEHPKQINFQYEKLKEENRSEFHYKTSSEITEKPDTSLLDLFDDTEKSVIETEKTVIDTENDDFKKYIPFIDENPYVLCDEDEEAISAFDEFVSENEYIEFILETNMVNEYFDIHDELNRKIIAINEEYEAFIKISGISAGLIFGLV